MPDKNSTLTYRWMQEVWNNGREDAIDEMMDTNAVTHGIEDIKENGTAGFKQFFRNFFAFVGLAKGITPNAEVGVFHQPHCCRSLREPPATEL